ncbi:hypothetical protein MnBA_39660 [Marinobacterium sp. BA1]
MEERPFTRPVSVTANRQWSKKGEARPGVQMLSQAPERPKSNHYALTYPRA